jgi:hypothetical protein
VPSEESDGLADGDKLKAELHLAAKPDVIPDDAVFDRVGATFPNSSAEQEGTGLDRHVPVGVDRAWNSDLVEEIEEI